ncbi:MAG: potassium transporter Kup [Blastochloris sp.]|nr:potassium transporter Kup [Blastochloris sp.]
MSQPHKQSTAATALLALGVVYGDIGTSPLYTVRECFSEHTRLPLTETNIFGVISLLFWSLTIIVGLKYLLMLVRADNQGEGGIFALLGLARGASEKFTPRTLATLTLIALCGAALLYGDGMITPAISVLAAVEGLKIANPNMQQYVVPIAAGVLLGLFLMQRRGSAKLGLLFGPVMVIWFVVLGVLGLIQVVQNPIILKALSPHYGVQLLFTHGFYGILLMGAVLLCVTGCEALYADIGHFGRKAMQISWFTLAYPGLILNYFGQGALLLEDGKNLVNPFYKLVPDWGIYPMVILATLATIIASQAMITGVFSLTQQAMQLGFLPRLKVMHTSDVVRGQIYMPQVNFILMIACISLVFFFKSSSALAAAYGLSVSTNMICTTIIFYFIITRIWKWKAWQAAAPLALFLIYEIGYFTGSFIKLFEGGWIPMLATLFLGLAMVTWRDGRRILMERISKGMLPLDLMIKELKRGKIVRVPGTAVFMSSLSDGVPLALMHHLKHNKALHESVVLLTIEFQNESRVRGADRITSTEMEQGFHRVILRYGFSETPKVMHHLCQALGIEKKDARDAISFYQSREVLLTDGSSKMARWQKNLFAFLSRISRPATGYFELPPRQVVEIGIQIDL